MSVVDGTIPKTKRPIAIDYVGTYSNTSGLTTYTFTGCSIGAADGTREVFVLISSFASIGNPTVSSATIGGVSASVIGSNCVSNRGVHLIRATVPTGTTADVSITFSAEQANCSIAVYRVVNRKTLGAAATDSSQNNGTALTTIALAALDVAAGGFVLAVMNTSASHTSPSLSGIGTMTVDANPAPATTGYCAMGKSSVVATAVSSGTVTWSWTTSRTVNAMAWSFD